MLKVKQKTRKILEICVILAIMNHADIAMEEENTKQLNNNPVPAG